MTNYAVNTHRSLTLVVTPSVLTGLALISLFMRLYARRLKRAPILADDYLAVLATIMACAALAFNIVMVVVGGGTRTVPEMTDHNDLNTWQRYNVATYLTWMLSIAVVQFSVLFLYKRLFGIHKWFRVSCYVGMVIITAWLAGGLGSYLNLCKPPTQLLDPVLRQRCGRSSLMCTAVGLTHVVIDVLLLAMPLPLIWGLKTTLGNKIIISVLFAIGAFASVASVLRLSCILHLGTYSLTDQSSSTWLSLLFTYVEVPVAIICSCVTAMGPVWIRLKQSRVGSYARKILSIGSSADQSAGSSADGIARGGAHPRGIEPKMSDGEISVEVQYGYHISEAPTEEVREVRHAIDR